MAKKLKEDVDRLDELVKVFCEWKGTAFTKWTDVGERKNKGKESIFDLIEDPASSSNRPLSKEEIIRTYMEELEAELHEEDADAAVVNAKMNRIQDMHSECLVEQMRTLFTEKTGIDVQAKDEITLQSVIASMDAAMSRTFPMEDWLKKPEQPKGFSRSAWMEHVKISKKFAECFAHMCEVERTGNLEDLNLAMAFGAVLGVDDWEDKYAKALNIEEQRNEHISKLFAFEILRRLDEHEYFFCTSCASVMFNVPQYIAHFSTGHHCKRARQAINEDGPGQLIAHATKHLLKLSSISADIHLFFSTQYSSPYLESGNRVPRLGKKCIPSEIFLNKIEKKYAKKINGDVDQTRISDSTYLASILPDIIKNHKGDVGKELFKEIDDYFAKGKKLFCIRCRVMVSTRALFYKHVANPYHLNADYLDDGKQLNLLTMSINIHTREIMI
ncbi:hypothetical protein PRIPAC_89267 [Pristionchus pacificus]|uniref:Uncharacterized protein n=1 Tax=Pristionchus pacificus TaxID=54126 RepID=A0A2A6B776_PRIPA|nr:hypothetical protein PRIPAC_89267 [Pristionchus pacificus]|eukprot:PDM61726.1 hypothetical protein PRIPAC_51168 [Pristionchus pacificus]